MSRFKNKNIDTSYEDEILDSEIENISMEDLDKEMDEFYIDKEAIENIKAPKEMKLWVRESIEKAQSDIQKEKKRKKIIKVAASFIAVVSVGVYSPSLAHFAPPIEKMLVQINKSLNVDGIASFIGIDKVIPKVEINENNKLELKKIPKYKVEKEPKENEDVLKESEVSSETPKLEARVPKSELDSVILIHRMSNSIIIARDNRKIGHIDINPQNIDIAISSLTYIQDKNARDYLNSLLMKWKEGNFNNAVEVHNFVWDMLNGNVGKAKSVDYSEVDKIVNKYFNKN